MYRMSRYEFIQFQIAENKLKELKMQHAAELQQAYDDISPTLTYFDYDLGRVYQSSIDPADYAIYLVEMQEEHERIEHYWKIRAEAYKKALAVCGEDKQKLFEALSEIISTTPELQRKQAVQEDFEDLEEYDRQVEEMSEDELFRDYWSLDEYLIKNEKIIDKCLWLRKVKDMTYKEIGETIGITSSRAKEIIKDANLKELHSNVVG